MLKHYHTYISSTKVILPHTRTRDIVSTEFKLNLIFTPFIYEPTRAQRIIAN